MTDDQIHSCHCCGLIQTLPPLEGRCRARCCRCRTPISCQQSNNRLSASLALAALILYLPAVLLPMLRLEQLGHVREDSLVAGVITMFSEGYWFIGSLIFLFSVVFPPVKLIALGVLSFQSSRTARPHHARVYRAVELLGKWSMLDVMLVALLVAFVKLGDLIDISPGHGVIAFAMMVFLSLLSGLLFNPRQMWSERTPSHA